MHSKYIPKRLPSISITPTAMNCFLLFTKRSSPPTSTRSSDPIRSSIFSNESFWNKCLKERSNSSPLVQLYFSQFWFSTFLYRTKAINISGVIRVLSPLTADLESFNLTTYVVVGYSAHIKSESSTSVQSTISDVTLTASRFRIFCTVGPWDDP